MHNKQMKSLIHSCYSAPGCVSFDGYVRIVSIIEINKVLPLLNITLCGCRSVCSSRLLQRNQLGYRSLIERASFQK
jgi:hypothetical protein